MTQAGYVFEHKGKQYDPSGVVSVGLAEEHNAALERDELAYWQTKPPGFIGYYVKRANGSYSMTTWRGTEIGTIFWMRKGYGPSGHSLLYIRVRGTNGATYYGKFGHECTQAVRLHRNV